MRSSPTSAAPLGKGPSQGVGDLWRRIQVQIQRVLCLPRVLKDVQEEESFLTELAGVVPNSEVIHRRVQTLKGLLKRIECTILSSFQD